MQHYKHTRIHKGTNWGILSYETESQEGLPKNTNGIQQVLFLLSAFYILGPGEKIIHVKIQFIKTYNNMKGK